MAKEIHEQPEVVGHTLSHYLDFASGRTAIPKDFAIDFTALDRLSITACGTAYYAGLVAKYWFERFARLPVDIDIASEFRYREQPLGGEGAVHRRLAIRRDSRHARLAALCQISGTKGRGDRQRAGIDDRAGGRFRPADACRPGDRRRLDKAFTSQLAVLACLAVAAGKARRNLSGTDEANLVRALSEAPRLMSEALRLEAKIEALALTLSHAKDVLYLGRGTSFPIALDGALKLKGNLLHPRRGLCAGELKHGPIALIDETMR